MVSGLGFMELRGLGFLGFIGFRVSGSGFRVNALKPKMSTTQPATTQHRKSTHRPDIATQS